MSGLQQAMANNFNEVCKKKRVPNTMKLKNISQKQEDADEPENDNQLRIDNSH